MTFSRSTTNPPATLALIATVLAASLSACGGGSDPSPTTLAAPATSASDVAPADAAAASAAATGVDLSQVEALPAFHMAAAELAEPDDTDVGGTNVSARMAPHAFTVDAALAGVDTTRLTPQMLASRIAAVRTRAASMSSAAGGSVSPAATGLTGAVFTPAQIRAAYGLPALPAVGASISAAVAATLGAGQTIYVLDAYHDASALSDLNLFSTRFGLPTCTAVAIPVAAAMPLAKPAARCTLSTVYATSAGTMTTTVPAYNNGWLTESKLDVQWAHAIAPLARIVLVETHDSMTNNLLGGIALAGRMGPGVVTMSFGTTEAGWAPSVDSKFTGTGMTYVAAAGDSGAQVVWPAVSPKVLAVGGTGLNWSGSGTRREEAWAGSGGGVSLYEALPAWQAHLTLAGTALPRRGVADVAFNANPMTGQYVALTAPGQPTKWTSIGGTSIGAPQWAGIVAVANAMRVAASKAVLGDVHPALYQSIGTVPGTYATAFADIVTGSNGTCSTCSATTGFDTTTGLGTPNVGGLLTALTGTTTKTTVGVAAPTVPGGAYTGRAGVALSQSLGIRAPAGVTTAYALSGAPSGLVVDASGTLKWTKPVAGTYTFTAKATTSAGGTGSGTYKLTVATVATAVNHAPTLAAMTLPVHAGTSFSLRLNGKDADGDAISYAMTGAPAGLTLSAAGVLAWWGKPVKGTYALHVTVTDVHGARGAGTLTLIVS